MADVFISYERGSKPMAKRLADRLTAGGFEVWWDEQIPAHRAYAEVIEERLRAARCVIVLWSQAAVQSQWVRAEANLARGDGKLIQAVLDDATPPLPFDQIQHADLRGWTGHANHPGWRKIEASVRELAAAAPAPPAAPSQTAPAAAPKRRRMGLMIGAAALAALILVGGGAWMFLHRAGSETENPPTVAIMPVKAAEPALAGLAADIADAETERLNGLAPLTGEAANGKAALRLDGRVETQGDHVHATLRVLNGDDQTVLWTGGIDRAPADAASLPLAVSTKANDMLHCGLDTLNPADRLTNADRSLYLRICDARRNDPAEATDLARRLAIQAPRFGRLQAEFALGAILSLDRIPEQERATLLAQAAAATDRALKSSPKHPFVYIAKELLVEPRSDWLTREEWLQKGAAIAPDPTLFNYYSDMLMEVGRWNEAVLFCRRGVQLDGGSAPKTATLIERLAVTGAASEARDRLVEAQKTWSDRMAEPAVRMIAFSDPAATLPLIDKYGLKVGLGDDQGIAAWRVYVQARTSRAPAAAAQATDLLARALAEGRLPADMAVRALLSLGRTDLVEAYFRRQGVQKAYSATEALFSPEAAAFRRTPAFMTLANDVGLGRYWKASGKWPDFCTDASLPYRCQDLAK